ncbi:hypothetical protein NA57DRAFT_44441, partial [Rhizodiscina lignyota]
VHRFQSYIEDSLGSYAPRFRAENSLLEPHNHFDVATGPQGLPFEDSHYPIEIDMGSRSTIDLEQQVTNLDSADMDYLRAKGAFELPPYNLQEDLVQAYFAEVNPVAPIINRTKFLNEFHNHCVSSRLLLFAVFTAGCKACRNPLLLDHKGTNHQSARRFYKVTKALLDTGYEQDKVARIQALLLITWWWDKKDDGGRNMRACAVDAINTAQSIGMHRWDQYPRSDPVLRGLWKRVWWTCFMRDVGVATSHGLPCIISLSEFDVHFLVAEDFSEEPHVPPDQQQYPYSNAEISFFIEQAKIMEMLHLIQSEHITRFRLHSNTIGPIADRQSGGTEMEYPPGVKNIRLDYEDDYHDQSLKLLKQWFETVPEAVRYDVDDIQGHRFWPAFLHILYFTAICIRFRERAVSRPTDARARAERQYCQSRGIAAASMIFKILRNVRAHGHIYRCTGLLTQSVFNCLIFFLIEGQSLNEEVRKDARNKYSLCLNVLYEFSQLWVSASLIHRLFESLQGSMQFRKERPHSIYFDQWLPPVPGLHVSSDITNQKMRELLATEFYYAPSSTDVTGFEQSSNSISTGFTPNFSFPMDDTSPHYSQGFPENLDVEQWYDLRGIRGVYRADT